MYLHVSAVIKSLLTFVDSLNFMTELPIEPFSGAFYPDCQSGMESQLTACQIQLRKDENCSQPAAVRCSPDGEKCTHIQGCETGGGRGFICVHSITIDIALLIYHVLQEV